MYVFFRRTPFWREGELAPGELNYARISGRRSSWTKSCSEPEPMPFPFWWRPQEQRHPFVKGSTCELGKIGFITCPGRSDGIWSHPAS